MLFFGHFFVKKKNCSFFLFCAEKISNFGGFVWWKKLLFFGIFFIEKNCSFLMFSG
ncbi:hypothetical protein HanXRQr2_Chr13g0580011 [Helianthus annuus]|uniref:Uncharacterized protein n=1 Tax=Helianthus annuus TaxID=4232 RepID=A0A251STM7_HELAN|nr:hypothetical protein HanXRQr2_Chr13g0580011 [Helianthus annuus]